MYFLCFQKSRPTSDEPLIHVQCHPCCPQIAVMTTSLCQTSSDTEPYHPFASLDNYIFTNNCVCNNLKAEVINIFLEQHYRIPNSPITLKNANQMYKILDHPTSLSTKGRIFLSSLCCSMYLLLYIS